MKNISAFLNRNQGLWAVLPLLIALASGFSSAWMKLPEQQRDINIAVIFIAGLLVVSLVIDAWYARTWGWLGGLRVSTAARRAALVQNGRDEVEERVAAERARVRKPAWEIHPHENRGHVDYTLYNKAYPVTKVQLTAPSEYFDFEGYAPRFPDPFEGQIGGGFSGKYFPGHPTDKGMSEGVDFTVHWVDENGDPQQKVERVEPEHLKRSATATAEDEKAR